LKKRISISPRQLLLYVIIFIVFTVLILALFLYRKDEKQFTRLTHDLFVEEMTGNTLNMHYTLANPKAFGIHDYQPVLPAYNPNGRTASDKAINTTLAELSDIRPGKLSKSDAYTYELLTRSLENSKKLNNYTLYQMPLAPSSGMQSQLPILLAEYTFRNARDIEDYLALLNQTDEYFASLLTFEQEKLASGTSMSTYSLRQAKEQCDTIVTKEELQEGTHFLQTTFSERITALINNGTISKQAAEEYLAENNRLLLEVVQPAYEALADGLFLMEDESGVSPFPTGLAAKPEGQEYYQYLLISETGSYRPVSEVKALLEERLKQEYNYIMELATQNPELSMLVESQTYTVLPCDDAATMLSDLQNRMQPDFPGLPDTSSAKTTADNSKNTTSLPNVTVKPVSASLQEFCAPAFYLTAPLDDTDNNVIYINEKSPLSDLELYTTLAHEGYPGHLYQTVFNNRDFMELETNKARQLLWYGGYLEGWALYVEFYGYDYATRLLEEAGRTEDALCVQLEKHNRSLLLCIYSMLDIMIHYENASVEDVAAFLADFGINSPSAARAVYCYIADEPCNYLKYYLGYLEFLELKETAKTLWQENYCDYDFHSFVLEAGPSDFTALTQLLNNTPARRAD